MFVPGNAYLDNAEFNWWFDPEATQVVLRAAIPHYIIPIGLHEHDSFDRVRVRSDYPAPPANDYYPANAQFYAFYVDLLTQPVPVKFTAPSCGFDH